MGASDSKPALKQRHILMQLHNMSDEQSDSVIRSFKSRASKKGYMSFQDFRALYTDSRFELDPSDQRAVFRALADSDRLTLAGFARLCRLCDQREGESAEAECLRVLFSVMDSDGSGAISESEFCHFLTNFVDDDATKQKFFSNADEDSSKLIDFYEFASFCRRHRRALRLMCAYVFPPSIM